jgi:hypothetical protein
MRANAVGPQLEFLSDYNFGWSYLLGLLRSRRVFPAHERHQGSPLGDRVDDTVPLQSPHPRRNLCRARITAETLTVP